MQELEKVVDAFIKFKSDCIPKEIISEDSFDDFANALAEKTKAKIIEEVKEKCKSEILEEANAEIKKEADRQRIKELKSLMWNGFIIAFIVGLAVNQVTTIVEYYKGTSTVESILSTVIISIILIGFCVALYFYSFIKNAISIFETNDKENEG